MTVSHSMKFAMVHERWTLPFPWFCVKFRGICKHFWTSTNMVLCRVCCLLHHWLSVSNLAS